MEEVKEEVQQWELAKVNKGTGEIIDLNRPFKTGLDYKVARLEKDLSAVEKLNTTQGRINFRQTNDCRYTSVYIDTTRRNPFGKNALFRGYLDILRDRLCIYTNAICQDKEYPTQGIKPLNKNEMIEYLEISKTQFYRFFKEAKDLGVLCEVTYDTNGEKRTAVLLNPAYSHQSVELSWEVCYAFANDKTFQSVLKESHIVQIERVNTDIKYLK